MRPSFRVLPGQLGGNSGANSPTGNGLGATESNRRGEPHSYSTAQVGHPGAERATLRLAEIDGRLQPWKEWSARAEEPLIDSQQTRLLGPVLALGKERWLSLI